MSCDVRKATERLENERMYFKENRPREKKKENSKLLVCLDKIKSSLCCDKMTP